MKAFLVISVILFTTLLGHTTTWWVDPTNGIDTNPGTFTSPWKSQTNIGKTGSSVMPGDTVILTNGVYNNAVSLIQYKQSGTASQPISVVGQSTNAIICGVNIVGSYWNIQNIGLGGTPPFANNPLFVVGGSNVTLTGVVANFYLYEGVIGNLEGFQLSGTNDLFTKCTIMNISNSTGMTIAGLSNVMTGCLTTNCIDFKCIKNFGNWGVCSNSSFVNIYYDGLGNHGDIFQSFGDGDATSPVETMSNFTFTANYVSNCPEGTQMWYETIDNSGGYGYFDGLYIYDNIFIKIDNQGVSGFPHTYIFNNTFIRCVTNSGQQIRLCNVPASGSGNANLGIASNSLAYNNVFLNCGLTNSSYDFGYIENDGAPGVVIDYNYACSTNFGTLNSAYFGGSWGAHTINGGNPGIYGLTSTLFTCPMPYTLLQTSILRNSGLSNSITPITDFNGTNWTEPDIGAIAYYTGGGGGGGGFNLPVFANPGSTTTLIGGSSGVSVIAH